jgi:antitoxin HicB
MSMREYHVFLEEAEEGGYVATCPALPGCEGDGDNREEALENIKRAIESYLQSSLRHGDPLPRIEVEIVKVSI